MAEELTDQQQARITFAAELRRGMHLFMSHEPDVSALESLTATLRAGFDSLASEPERARANLRWEGPAGRRVPADGHAFPESLDRPVSGSANPFGTPMTMYRDGDAVAATVTLDAGFEGAPGRSHGGFVSAIFDDLFGSLPMLDGKIAFTGSLTVDYVAASPVFRPVTYRGWVERTEGRKLFMAGEAHDGDTLVTTARAVFIDATDLIAKAYGQAE